MVDGFDTLVAGHLLRAYSTRAEIALRQEARLARGREKAAVARAKAAMIERLDENIGLDALSDLAGLPPFVLLRRFRQKTGTTPHAWLTERRLARARQMLLAARTPIAEIVLDCGFSSQSHLTQTFSKHLGPPRDASERTTAEHAGREGG